MAPSSIMHVLFTLLCLIRWSSPIPLSNRGAVRTSHRIFTLKASERGDSLSRRRKRRSGNSGGADSIENNGVVEETKDSKGPSKAEADGSNSLEDLLGLGNDQLRELMEQELPVPREDLITRKAVKNEDKNKVFKLPDLGEYMQSTESSKSKEMNSISPVEEFSRVDRKNMDEYLRVMQLNPFADADESMFLDEYDIIPSIFGSGKLLGIPIPYLQSGHGILLIISLLAALVYAPGNPLTEFPREIRTFLTQGLEVVYSINFVLAVLAFSQAKGKNLPAVFWFLKTFILGGIAYYEITQAKDPKDINRIDPSDRKSKRK